MSGDRTYYIDFNTKEAPGLIKATRVVLGSDLVRDDKHTFKINLCDDPIYPQLVRYVLNNPPRKEHEPSSIEPVGPEQGKVVG